MEPIFLKRRCNSSVIMSEYSSIKSDGRMEKEPYARYNTSFALPKTCLKKLLRWTCSYSLISKKQLPNCILGFKCPIQLPGQIFSSLKITNNLIYWEARSQNHKECIYWLLIRKRSYKCYYPQTKKHFMVKYLRNLNHTYAISKCRNLL